MLRHDFQGQQGRHSHHNARDAPEPAPKPQGQKHHEGIEFQSSSDNQWLHHLTFDGGQREVARGNGGDVTDAIERDESDDGEQD
jgi:pectate lyase